jgi:sulfur-oxidizing protein SoxX
MPFFPRAVVAVLVAAATVPSLRGSAAPTFEVSGDAIPAPLEGRKGDAVRGLAVILDRRTGNCLICHSLNVPDEAFQGEIGPPLDGVGGRLSAGQIRLRIADQSRLNPDTLMPPYYRVTDLVNVAPEYRGNPALDSQQIEDIVAYLSSLKE